MPLSLFEQERQGMGMLIIDQKDHNGNDINGFIVLHRIEKLNYGQDGSHYGGEECWTW